MLIAPVVANTYTHAIGLANGQVHNQAYEVFQQDVTGLVPLRQAILETASSGQSGTVWKLFYSACIVLREYGKLWTGNLSLQCPESIAVGPNNRVVLLDAEVQISGYRLNGNEEAAQTFIHWFGSKGAHGFAQPATASLLHAKALLRFFLEVLHGAQKQASPNVQATLDAVIAELGKINQAQKHTNLQDCEQSIEFMFATDPSFKDWSEQLMGPDVELVETTQKSNRQRPPSKNVFLRLSLLVNLLLLLTLVFLFWPSRRSDGTVLMMSSYCVIFPTQGTISEKVNASLQDLFPGKILDIKPGEAERERLLGEKLTESVKSIEDIEKLHKLLSVLFNKHSRFFVAVCGEDSQTCRFC